MRWYIAFIVIVLMGMASAAHAQAPTNPYRPSPIPRYPVCNTTFSNVLTCTANPNGPQDRSVCGNSCPEDRPNVYRDQFRGALNRVCGDPEGQGCIGAFFERTNEPMGMRCIYRIVDEDEDYAPSERDYVVRVSQLQYQTGIDMVKRDNGSHARYGRRYGRQVRDYERFNAPPPPGYYSGAYRSPCRH